MEIKDTRLDDSAEIYKKRSDKPERHKLKELHGKEKLQYFSDYYLKIVLVAVLVIALSIYFIYSVWIAQRVETILNVAIADYVFSSEALEDASNRFGEYIKIDSESQKVLLDNSYYISVGDYSSTQKLSTYILVGEVDIIITKESIFQSYVLNGSLSSLTDTLPTDLYSTLSDHFYYGRIRENPEETLETATGSLETYGIYLDQCPMFQSQSTPEDRPVLGIVATGKHIENSFDFIRFLFQEYQPPTNPNQMITP